jgi:hypothetical protein
LDGRKVRRKSVGKSSAEPSENLRLNILESTSPRLSPYDDERGMSKWIVAGVTIAVRVKDAALQRPQCETVEARDKRVGAIFIREHSTCACTFSRRNLRIRIDRSAVLVVIGATPDSSFYPSKSNGSILPAEQWRRSSPQRRIAVSLLTLRMINKGLRCNESDLQDIAGHCNY